MNRSRLVREVRHELPCLKRVAEAAGDLLKNAGPSAAPWCSAAAAKYASDVFMGLENLWKRKCRHLGEPLPDGPTSHHDVLIAFLDDPALGKHLPPGTQQHLASFLRFRHRFVHGYGYEVTWDMVKEPLALIPRTIEALSTVWQSWLAELPDGTDV